MADALGIKRSLVGAYEEARATPRYDVLEQLSKLTGHSIADILNKRLVPEGHQNPVGRGRKPANSFAAPVAKLPVSSAPHAFTQAFGQPKTEAQNPQTIATSVTLTLDTAGNAVASLVSYAVLPLYPTQYVQVSFIGGLPVLSLPFLQPGLPYRAFETSPGHIHVAGFVRNWATITPADDQTYVLVTKSRVWVAKAMPQPKGIGWQVADTQTPITEEPQEIWSSAWVIANKWAPLPAWLAGIEGRLTNIEQLLRG